MVASRVSAPAPIMDDQVTRVCTLIRARSPHVFSPCLANSLDMTEHEVRDPLQVAVARPDTRQHFALTRRLCFGCGVMGDYVGPRR